MLSYRPEGRSQPYTQQSLEMYFLPVLCSLFAFSRLAAASMHLGVVCIFFLRAQKLINLEIPVPVRSLKSSNVGLV